MPPSNPLLVLIGGFLGSGKTTLLLRAATSLKDRGLRVAVITNDQAGELVDTRLVNASGCTAEEVASGCFCCHFSDFISAAERLRSFGPHVIFAEPVGSCVDISATVLQPLKELFSSRFRLAPFTVLADPERARRLLQPEADAHFSYLFRSQLEEADLVCFTKSDMYSEFPELPVAAALRLSARTGEGLNEWLDYVLAGEGTPGGHLLDVDYSKYAEAEAALGWLNWKANFRSEHPLAPATVVGPFLDRLTESLSLLGAEIAHLKVFDQTPAGYIKASVCQNGEEPVVDGDLLASTSLEHELVLNLRAKAAPEILDRLVDEAAGDMPGRVSVIHRQSFRPSRPLPEHRFTEVV
jgi:hypothetical protein